MLVELRVFDFERVDNLFESFSYLDFHSVSININNIITLNMLN